jgi:predicted aminopeptidase
MRPLAPALALLAASGCSTLGYLGQAASGQFQMLHGARSIPKVLEDAQTPPRIRALLSEVEGIKAFGVRHGLKATPNYRRYCDLGREAAVWVVQACAPLAFEPRRWTFPLVGSVPYLGYFSRQQAQAHADALAREGWDVDVRPASAYSTLGWFSDPVLSTMISPGEEALGDLANVVLHESVHATVYVAGQSAFDESLASFVADRLTAVWLERELGAGAPQTLAWKKVEADRQSRVDRLHGAYQELDAVYRSARSAEQKRAEKARVLESVQRALSLKRPINNATLVGFRTYDAGGPHFERLLAACGGRLPAFLRAVRTVSGADFSSPQQQDLAPVIDRLAVRCRPATP